MIRIALLALLLISPGIASASEIESKATMGCQDIRIHEAITRMAGASDGEAIKKLAQRSLITGACEILPVGTKVRIEKNSWPYACVAVIGEIDPCLWIMQREVKP